MRATGGVALARRAVRHVLSVAALGGGLAWAAGAAAEVPPDLAGFLADRPTFAAALAEPIAACVARRDTAHPAFHGCIDWHSSVHGVWALTAYGWATGDRRHRPLIERTLDPQLLARERHDLARSPGFEMPYGRAWFLRLAIDHRKAFDSDLLAPFADEVARSLVDRYTTAPPDPLSVAYDNASWALINLYDYGRSRGDDRIVDFVTATIRARYLADGPCPVERAELSRPEFMAVCTNWAWLVQLVLPPDAFKTWLGRFLPRDPPLVPIAEPVNAHQVGLNFSRAWGLWRLYRATDDARFLKSYLGHFRQTYARPALWKGDYRSVGHWVAQFGMFALMVSYNDLR
jgi:hypothetical protein